MATPPFHLPAATVRRTGDPMIRRAVTISSPRGRPANPPPARTDLGRSVISW